MSITSATSDVFEDLLYAVTRLSVTGSDGSTWFGTGFIYAISVGSDSDILALVSNRHVLEGAASVRVELHESDLIDGQLVPSIRKVLVNITDLHVVYHPNDEVDLALLPFTQTIIEATDRGAALYYKALTEQLVPTDAGWKDFSALEQVLMIGCPNGLFDEFNKIPIMRRGSTATPMYMNYNGKEEFLVDIAAFPGSSGSPVFSYSIGQKYNKAAGKYELGGGAFNLVGVLYAGPTFDALGNIVLDKTPKIVTQSMLHLGNVIKSICIRDLAAIYVDLWKPLNAKLLEGTADG